MESARGRLGEGGPIGPGGGLKGCLRAVWASNPAKKSENKTPGVFFHAAFDFDAPGPQNTTQKSKNIKKTDFQKSRFSKIDEKLI